LKPDQLIGQNLNSFLPDHVVKQLQSGIDGNDFSIINPMSLPRLDEKIGERLLIAHRSNDQLLLEVERVPDRKNDLQLLNRIDRAISRIQSVRHEKELFQTVVKEVRAITDYDRIMIYRFDKDYNGEVVAEEKVEHIEAFLGIHYPATDIPKQARDLFLDNRVRMLVDVDDELSFIHPPVHPVTGDPLNVSGVACRGVSPIHLEYLRNMGVRATLNVAIVEDEKLWGLIACHNYSPRVLDYRLRNLIRFVGQIISGHLSLYRATRFREMLLHKNKVQARLFANMNQEKNLVAGLLSESLLIQELISSCGVAIIFDEQIHLLGETPDEGTVVDLAKAISKNCTGVLFATDSLPIEPIANGLRETMVRKYAGLLSVSLSDDQPEYLIW
ncbi:MAG: GAF domain-containing protein, partial [Bacteroidota bacterium]